MRGPVTYCILCDKDPCVCPLGKTREITIRIDEDTCKAIKEEALGGTVEDQAARILTGYVRRRSASSPRDPNSWMV